MDGASMRLRREHNERAWAVWTTAALTRAKKMPRLEKLLLTNKPVRRRQTWQEQAEIMKNWAEQHNKYFGDKANG